MTVSPNYLIPNQDSGIVIFIGEKEDYGKGCQNEKSIKNIRERENLFHGFFINILRMVKQFGIT